MALLKVSASSSPLGSSPKEEIERPVCASRTGGLPSAVLTAQMLPLQKSP